MDREIYKRLSMFKGLDVDAYQVEEQLPFLKSDLPFSAILNEIFAVNPESGLPKGDLSYYLSPDGNPEIKAWLETNLLKPVANSRGLNIDGLTDDIRVEFSRNDGESRSDYIERISAIRQTAISDLERLNSLKDGQTS